MLEIYIPGFGLVRLDHLVSDFTGTLSVDGELLPWVREQLKSIAEFMKIHICLTVGLMVATIEPKSSYQGGIPS